MVIRLQNAFVARDAAAFQELLDPSCVLHQCGFLNPIIGSSAIAELASRAEDRLSEWDRRIVDVVAEGDIVAVRSTTSGRHTQPMFVDPTEKRVQFDSMTFVRFKGGKVAEIWNIQDTATLLSQLDAWPS
jgi:predicted ester cyclase